MTTKYKLKVIRVRGISILHRLVCLFSVMNFFVNLKTLLKISPIVAIWLEANKQQQNVFEEKLFKIYFFQTQFLFFFLHLL